MRLGQWLGMMLLGGCTFFAWAAAPSESEGITLESTRVIYPASAKNSITFTVSNHTPYVYLLQSQVLPWTAGMSKVDEQDSVQKTEVVQTDLAISDSSAAPFIVLPPLTRFAPNEAMVLRIRLTKNDLPKDRESIFSLSLKAIPSQGKPSSEGEGNEAKMVLALQNNLKLFYRPTDIAVIDPDERAAALQFSQQGTQLVINNPTPYYVTLGNVKVGAIPVDIGHHRMLAPFSQAAYDIVSQQGQKISWQVIDDEGQRPPSQTRSLN